MNNREDITERDVWNWMKEVWENAPDEVKQAAPFFISCTSNNISAFIKHENTIKPVTKLCLELKNNNCLDPTVAAQLLDQCNIDLVVQNRSQIFKALTDFGEECHESVIQGLQDQLTNIANRSLGVNLIISFFCIVIEIIYICNFWERINEAKNMVGSSITNRRTINESIESITPEIKVLNNYIKDIASGKSNELLRVNTLIQIDKIREMLNKLENDIRDLEVEIKGMKVRLGASRSQAIKSVATNVSTGLSSLVNIGMLASAADPWLVAFNGIFIVCHAVLSITDIRLYLITEEDMKMLQAELNEIIKLENIRKSLKIEFESNAIQAKRLIRAQASTD